MDLWQVMSCFMPLPQVLCVPIGGPQFLSSWSLPLWMVTLNPVFMVFLSNMQSTDSMLATSVWSSSSDQGSWTGHGRKWAQRPVLFCTWHLTMFLEFPTVPLQTGQGSPGHHLPQNLLSSESALTSPPYRHVSVWIWAFSHCMYSAPCSSYGGTFHCLLRGRITSLLEPTEKHLCFTACHKGSSLAPSASQPIPVALPLPVWGHVVLLFWGVVGEG